MERIESHDEALKLLKDGEILCILNDREAVFFAWRKERVLVKGSSSTYRLTESEWLNLFKDSDFLLYERAPEETVNLQKDEEYYSWRHK